jgi:hypothetical protein
LRKRVFACRRKSGGREVVVRLILMGHEDEGRWMDGWMERMKQEKRRRAGGDSINRQ